MRNRLDISTNMCVKLSLNEAEVREVCKGFMFCAKVEFGELEQKFQFLNVYASNNIEFNRLKQLLN